jgi:hypothetical protein
MHTYIYIYSNSSLISLATISKVLFFSFFSRRERNMLASPHRWEANRSSCPRAPLCMQIVCIFILLHSVYDNSSLSTFLSLPFSSFRRHFLEFSQQKQYEIWREIRMVFFYLSWVFLELWIFKVSYSKDFEREFFYNVEKKCHTEHFWIFYVLPLV